MPPRIRPGQPWLGRKTVVDFGSAVSVSNNFNGVDAADESFNRPWYGNEPLRPHEGTLNLRLGRNEWSG